MTGGAGFIGCALSQRLAGQATSWTVIDNLLPQVHPSGERPADLHEAATLVRADVSQEQTWTELDGAPADTIIHLAAETGTGQSLFEASRHGLVNVVGTTRLTDWLSRQQRLPKHVLLTSSRAVYGEGRWVRADGSDFYPGQRSHEMLSGMTWDFVGAAATAARADLTHPSPTSVYGATKLAQEHILSAWALSQQVPLTVLRLQNVYGPGQSLTNSYTGIVTLFSRWAKSGKEIPVFEDGQIVRDFVYIDDVAEAVARGLGAPTPGLRILDVGSGVPTTIHGLATHLALVHAAPAPVVTGQFRDGDIRHGVADLAVTRRELGFEPKTDLATGLSRLQTWIDAQDEG
ncbi:MAG: NAD-dependent epimerase/dehydratase family protein [Candidatus Phosphoribacter sp.]